MLWWSIPQELGTIAENILGDDARMAWIDEANDREPGMPEDSDDERHVGWDWKSDSESDSDEDMSHVFDVE